MYKCNKAKKTFYFMDSEYCSKVYCMDILICLLGLNIFLSDLSFPLTRCNALASLTLYLN